MLLKLIRHSHFWEELQYSNFVASYWNYLPQLIAELIVSPAQRHICLAHKEIKDATLRKVQHKRYFAYSVIIKDKYAACAENIPKQHHWTIASYFGCSSSDHSHRRASEAPALEETALLFHDPCSPQNQLNEKLLIQK